MTEKNTTVAQGSIFFSKQPILDTKRSIWGYELLGGEIKEGLYEVFPRRESSAGLSSSTYLGLQEAMKRGKRIVVGFDDESILTGVPYALPAACGVVRVLAGEAHAPGLVAALRKLRSEGYLTVLDVVPGTHLPGALRDQGDILSFYFDAEDPEAAVPDRIEKDQAVMLARGLKTVEQCQTARNMGFALFQGSFFKGPERMRDRPLSSNEIARLNLFRLIEAENPDFRALAAAIRTDVSISFRLLSYLNSAWFGLRHSVQSIDQAIMMLGWVKLKNWLRAVLLLDMAGREEGPQELASLALQRGKLLELLTAEYDYWGFNPGTLFLMGLFSLLDAILQMPMEKVVELLPLDAKLKAALRRDSNNEYQPLFHLLEHLEDADWPALEALARKLFMDLDYIKSSFTQARDWAGGFFASEG